MMGSAKSSFSAQAPVHTGLSTKTEEQVLTKTVKQHLNMQNADSLLPGPQKSTKSWPLSEN